MWAADGKSHAQGATGHSHFQRLAQSSSLLNRVLSTGHDGEGEADVGKRHKAGALNGRRIRLHPSQAEISFTYWFGNGKRATKMVTLSQIYESINTEMYTALSFS
jgi:hypothetical protein